MTGSVAVVPVRLSGSPEPGEKVVLNTVLKKGDKSIALIQGGHLVFNESNWDKPAYMVFQADSKLTSYTSVNYEGLSGNIPMSWAVTFFVLAGLFFVLSFWHRFVLPRPDSDAPREDLKPSDVLQGVRADIRDFLQETAGRSSPLLHADLPVRGSAVAEADKSIPA
ncbi:MAG: hypothetical protein MZV63_20790 [Marinilabiliales bacterium]|nr:hypothetical protein [Marinilabiliales bacterium]